MYPTGTPVVALRVSIGGEGSFLSGVSCNTGSMEVGRRWFSLLSAFVSVRTMVQWRSRRR